MKKQYISASVIIILTIGIALLSIGFFKAQRTAKEMTKNYDKLSISYDSLDLANSIILLDNAKEIDSLLKISEISTENLKFIKRRNLENLTARRDLERKIALLNQKRNEAKKKEYSPEELDRRLITILRQ